MRSAKHSLGGSAFAGAFALAALANAHAAHAEPRHATTATPRLASAISISSISSSVRAPGGLSVGSPTEGHLVAGVRVEESPWLRIVPCHRDEDVRWGLGSLVAMIDRGARAVRKEFPDSVLSVGHLSRRGGGEIEAHASHESGRDADIGFYVVNQQGKAIYAEHFVPFVADGSAPSWPGAKFDDARNWAFVASVVTDPHAHVSYLFVASPLRARLLAYAQRIGAPYATRVRASEVMAQPRGSLPHDDHFHVRISCPSGMEACIEYPTRNVARARHGVHVRPRVHSPAVAPAAAPSPGSSGAASPMGTAAPAHKKPSANPNDDLPAIPSSATPPPPAAPATPPASLEAPIDDVDGVEDVGE